MLFALWTWLLTFDVGSEPSPGGPPPRSLESDFGGEPSPGGTPPR